MGKHGLLDFSDILSFYTLRVPELMHHPTPPILGAMILLGLVEVVEVAGLA